MYKHYCKDPQCTGHTKSWERCCDMRAFSNSNPAQTTPLQVKSTFNRSRSTFAMSTTRVFA